MTEQVWKVDDVFGVSRDVPGNYVTREDVDGKLVDSLTRNHHIVIYGSSKQGKTCLRKHCLDPDDYLTISCQNKWGLAELHSAILKEAGYLVRQSSSKTVSGGAKIAALAKGEAGLPLVAKGSVEIRADGDLAVERQQVSVNLELDPNDANDIIRALDEIGLAKFVVLEDFHYLPEETQRDFAFALKAFHEKSKICFIITGVWREENRLIGYNGDLTERVYSVDVDTWNEASLREVISSGEALLNVQFSDEFKDTLISNCFNSVHLVQEACRRCCRAAGVFSTGDSLTELGTASEAETLIKEVVNEQKGRYEGFLMNVSDGFQQTDLEMPKWVIFAILSFNIEQLEEGIRLREISKRIKANHPKGDNLNNGNITQALASIKSLQNSKGVRPIVLDYDGANRNLHVVDKGFLIWLATQDVADLRDDLSLPQPTLEGS
ncbi:hypothetical protein EXN24_23630 [Rhizobium rhizogenes]|uniref:Uncharacterized protein n=1 Tax=Rhizobium rhizogenes TaxID=359 RepID=A0AA94VAA8_RHIRH|nr:hypothetical protein [Rhizobium rhizogenes]TRA85477.1 hypothetical protein EXN24_23630 [Rhizobium rhizogenes]